MMCASNCTKVWGVEQPFSVISTVGGCQLWLQALGVDIWLTENYWKRLGQICLSDLTLPKNINFWIYGVFCYYTNEYSSVICTCSSHVQMVFSQNYRKLVAIVCRFPRNIIVFKVSLLNASTGKYANLLFTVLIKICSTPKCLLWWWKKKCLT